MPDMEADEDFADSGHPLVILHTDSNHFTAMLPRERNLQQDLEVAFRMDSHKFPDLPGFISRP